MIRHDFCLCKCDLSSCFTTQLLIFVVTKALYHEANFPCGQASYEAAHNRKSEEKFRPIHFYERQDYRASKKIITDTGARIWRFPAIIKGVLLRLLERITSMNDINAFIRSHHDATALDFIDEISNIPKASLCCRCAIKMRIPSKASLSSSQTTR